MAATLYLVATPIGNLGDMTPRAVKTLEEADFIAAEDTRVTMKLMNHFSIKKPIVSYYEHNKEASGRAILERLLSGESCALVTDAGMPGISDPGEDLVRLCAQSGVRVTVIPGASAVVSAVALSALPNGRFTFEGFLPVDSKSRKERLEALVGEERTMVFYEAPHKLLRTLGDLGETLGEERKITLCRELTKLHEEVIYTTLGESVEIFTNKPPRGEFVLVIEGKKREKGAAMDFDKALASVKELRDGGMRLKDAVKEVSEKSGYPKKLLYDKSVKE